MMLQASRPPGNGSRERASHPQDKSLQLAPSHLLDKFSLLSNAPAGQRAKHY